ncbi:uncharacterized protein BDZ99DRAFT_478078 [Mytilinidion resinicola]|uniref:Uncharacterized protein n=1 Tax=Mytilinidion resinicola TaxID=574789 RepID=A0A6A6YID6_9PEZI|nr:uncharacterized protein BDZ99DRAFT_478078 [Mytilinidion resinicola]KAF2808606.1 hypothetical protein BDZ99DRAFT_478078 [Mytilinidion resinicola]
MTYTCKHKITLRDSVLSRHPGILSTLFASISKLNDSYSELVNTSFTIPPCFARYVIHGDVREREGWTQSPPRICISVFHHRCRRVASTIQPRNRLLIFIQDSGVSICQRPPAGVAAALQKLWNSAFESYAHSWMGREAPAMGLAKALQGCHSARTVKQAYQSKCGCSTEPLFFLIRIGIFGVIDVGRVSQFPRAEPEAAVSLLNATSFKGDGSV